MISSKQNRLACILITIFTATAVLVTYCLGVVESLQAVDSAAEEIDSITRVVDNVSPSPAEEPVLLTKTGDPQFAPIRTGFQRIAIPCRNHDAAFAFYQSPFRTNSNSSFIATQNTILLKLRI
ncbi:MAG: hypothetical protein LBL76_03660 [Treponema sp.]|jgi:hypothetical protein|nr:hypothetical protein [Treponema sp.]